MDNSNFLHVSHGVGDVTERRRQKCVYSVPLGNGEREPKNGNADPESFKASKDEMDSFGWWTKVKRSIS